MREIDTCLAGNAFRAATKLNVGLSLEVAQRLEELDRKVEEGNKQLAYMLRRFNLERVDVKQIQNLLKASSGAQKTLLARSAHDLGVLLQAQQKLFADRQALRDRSEGRHPEALIRVRNTAYPGVALRIGDHVKTIQAEIASPVFRIRDGRIVEG
jgi:uncharacterized protein (DUF342 family)